MCLLVSSFLNTSVSQEQQEQHSFEQRMEQLGDEAPGEMTGEDFFHQLDQYRKHPLNLNRATENELSTLGLSVLQINNLLWYRQLMGDLISIYELQAIPGWDIELIRRIISLVTTNAEEWEWNFTGKYFADARPLLIVKYSVKAVRAADRNAAYEGDGSTMQIRFRYDHKNLLQLGISADKDAGEALFRKSQKNGFDFYSIHAATRSPGPFRLIALGDYTVQWGQGLIQWQGYGVGKSANVISIKQQGQGIQPFRAMNEFNFHRGAALTVNIGSHEFSAFASHRKFSANIMEDTNSQTRWATTINTSGYHRTAAEMADKNSLACTTLGLSLSRRSSKGKISLQAIQYLFNKPIHPAAAPYNYFYFRGRSWINLSVDYSYTLYNFHVFGESATGSNGKVALLNAVMASIDPKLSIALLHRHIAPGYHAFFSSAFMEQSTTRNEKGFYLGCQFFPSRYWQFQAYVDLFKFPWIKYRVDAPSQGRELLTQLNFTPSRNCDFDMRYRSALAPQNQERSLPFNAIAPLFSREFRMQSVIRPSKNWEHKTRIVFQQQSLNRKEWTNGFLAFAEIEYKNNKPVFGLQLRLQYHEVATNNKRIYAYEGDVLYSISVNSFSGRGFYGYVCVSGLDLVSLVSRKSFWRCRLYLKSALSPAEKSKNYNTVQLVISKK